MLGKTLWKIFLIHFYFSVLFLSDFLEEFPVDWDMFQDNFEHL